MTARDAHEYDRQTQSRLAELQALVQGEGLPFDGPARRTVEQVLQMLEVLRGTAVATNVHAQEQRERAAVQLSAACRLAFDWRSPGYSQAGVLSVGDVGSLVDDLEALLKAPVNYARWHQPGIEKVEGALGAQIGTVADRDALLATSSGLAALSVVLGVLRKLGRLGRILVVPGTYFETRPTLEIFGPAEIREAVSREAESVAAEAADWGADVVFADPLEHGPEQRVVDVEALADCLQRTGDSTTLVVDGTMVPASGVFGALAARSHPLVIYYESSAKYRHLGLDVTLGGAVVVPRRHAAVAEEVRQCLGAALDRFGCEVTPLPDPRAAALRLRAMVHASSIIARATCDRLPSGWRVVHPSLPSHPQAELAARRRYVGACVTFVPEDHSAEQVLRFVKRAVELARDGSVELVVGESLGFTACRLTPTVAAPKVRPFARLATGPISEHEAEAVAQVLTQAVLGA
jgi:O-succinylhomoserine sulfhydrylase